MNFPGLKEDCETLLSRFQATDSVRYEEFLAIWKDMQFSKIFVGGMRTLERNAFTGEAFSIACLYFLPPYTFQIRVGALYLLYGLYSTQLCEPKRQIRISLKDWSEVQSFHQDLISANHLDAAYVFLQMRLKRAFHFTAMPKFLTFQIHKNTPNSSGREEFKDVQDRVSNLVTSDTLEEIQNIHEHYRKTKCLISADKSQPDKSLSLAKDDFVDGLKNFVTEHQLWKLEKRTPKTKSDEEKEATSQESEGSERARALARIKAKSYNSVTVAPKSRRHRQVQLVSANTDPTDSQKRKRPRSRKSRRKTSKEMEDSDSDDDYEVSSKKSQHPKSSRMPVISEEEMSSSGEEFLITKRKRTK
ncbi:snRNA-activating protein complex subunit 1 [Spea bombifrons]|uniref:snRNA-activating protein complex subunit 1 n=1 Tax=Spea bombifrons TaxID=233779 RepID=UPI002349F2B0|nr:snRNA-activating protein complex subunit 1 [Spea bombifrons]